MRTTIVPAQITTVEDKIAGNFGMSQILLLITPVFGGSGMFVVLPPFFGYALYKIVLIGLIAVICGVLAIRIKGTILLFWAIILLRYNLRPRYYIFSKNDTHARDIALLVKDAEIVAEDGQRQADTVLIPPLNPAELVRVESLIADPHANVHFKTNKKGGVSVHLTESRQESLGTATN